MVVKALQNFFRRVFSGLFKGKRELKLGFYGPPNAGKTSLANRICKDFTGEEIGTVSKIPHETRTVQFKEKVEIEYKGKKMTFGAALEALKQRKKVAREGWNGKGMFIILVGGTSNVKPYDGTPYKKVCEFKNQEAINILPHIDMYSAQGEMVVGWLASQTDILAEDWQEVE